MHIRGICQICCYKAYLLNYTIIYVKNKTYYDKKYKNMKLFFCDLPIT